MNRFEMRFLMSRATWTDGVELRVTVDCGGERAFVVKTVPVGHIFEQGLVSATMDDMKEQLLAYLAEERSKREEGGES